MNAGEALRGGRSLKETPTEARIFYEQACALDATLGCLEAGMIALEQFGDTGTARAALGRACTAGVGQACRVLAEASTNKSSQERRELLLQGCDRNDPVACMLAAEMAGRDSEEARTLLRRACKLGERKACLP